MYMRPQRVWFSTILIWNRVCFSRFSTSASLYPFSNDDDDDDRFWSEKVQVSRFGPHNTTLHTFWRVLYLFLFKIALQFIWQNWLSTLPPLTFVLYFFSETSTWVLMTWIARRLAWVSFPHSRLLIHCHLWGNGAERLFGHASGTVTSWWRRIGTSRREED